MARRRASLLAVAGSVFMGASLWQMWWPWHVLAAVALLLSWAYPTWAWLPASVWLLLWGFFGFAWSLGGETFPQDVHWRMGLAGGLGVFVGSLLARRRRRRPRPQTDVSAFD
jgi:hypothetical protein